MLKTINLPDQPSIPKMHEISKVEKRMFLLYTLSSLNIPSAQETATMQWTRYMFMLSEVMR